MKKLKAIFCNHEFKFLNNKLNGLEVRLIKAICLHCGLNKEFTLEEYHEYLSKHSDKHS